MSFSTIPVNLLFTAPLRNTARAGGWFFRRFARMRWCLQMPTIKTLTLLALLCAAAFQSPAEVIPFDNQAGDWLAQVSGGDGTHGYAGFASNYGPITGPNTNFGPSIPGGYIPDEVAAFVDINTGQFGTSGSSFIGDVGAEADYNEAFQFSGAGTMTMTMHFQGSVSLGPANNFVYDLADLAGSISLADTDHTVNGSGSSGGSARICVDSAAPGMISNCDSASTRSISTDLVASLNVLPGHVYVLYAMESGLGLDGSFDGIDPASLSLQLSPGLTLEPINGFAPPPFLAQSSGDLVTPEPAYCSWLLAAGGLTILTFVKRRPN